ncbi:hypothetical protein AQPE_4722 [Aquipluma nitroreducens]|uniref:Uncharacterized protein n=2 Tax=Aquipluma nitroreducens TaxID=2010828 RepID=A0A5K7SG19_9BACT|nr:hypothetical protein AQPE_4722 [Aquipluma nitroreducens]
MNKDTNDMKQLDEFPGIGKKLPFREPVGFFERFSEKTLQQAKLREQNRKRSLVLWRTVAVAASVSALALLGYFMFETELAESPQIVQEKQPVEQPLIKEPEIAKQPEIGTEIKKKATEKVPEKFVAEEKDTEEIGDLLADLSDEELLQLAAMYKTDPFMSESEQ